MGDPVLRMTSSSGLAKKNFFCPLATSLKYDLIIHSIYTLSRVWQVGLNIGFMSRFSNEPANLESGTWYEKQDTSAKLSLAVLVMATVVHVLIVSEYGFDSYQNLAMHVAAAAALVAATVADRASTLAVARLGQDPRIQANYQLEETARHLPDPLDERARQKISQANYLLQGVGTLCPALGISLAVYRGAAAASNREILKKIG